MTIKVDALVTHLEDRVDIPKPVRALRFWSRIAVISNWLFVAEGWGGACKRTSDAPLWILTTDIHRAIESCREVDPATRKLSIYRARGENSARLPVIEEIEEVYSIHGGNSVSIKTASNAFLEIGVLNGPLHGKVRVKIYPFT